MQINLQKYHLATATVLAAVAIMTPVSVGALPEQAAESQARAQQQLQTGITTQERSQVAQQQRDTAQAAEQKEAGQARGEEQRQAASGRLEAAKLKACENREKAIQNIMSRLSDRGTKQLEVFTKISDRTQDFYIEQGYNLENYEALVAAVAAKKASAEEAVAVVSSSASEFSCDGENPKQVADSFKDLLHAQNAALHEYRTAIKDLIVGVKSVQPVEETEAVKTEETGE